MNTAADEPIHPTAVFFGEREAGVIPGLTKREYFAAIALQGLLSGRGGFLDKSSTQMFSNLATEYADALILALNESGEE